MILGNSNNNNPLAKNSFTATSESLKTKEVQDNDGSSSGSRYDSTDIFALLGLWAKKGGAELRPNLRQDMGGVVYNLEGFYITYEKLVAVEKKDLLKRDGNISFSCCAVCHSHILQVQLVCPDCKSQSLIKSNLLIHYDCNYSGPIEEFQSFAHGGYFCHKCRKELKRVGIDYGNPGIGFKCSSCKKVFQFPLVMSYCDAGHTSKIDELDLKTYPNYIPGHNAAGLFNLLADSQTVQESLKKFNLHSEIMVHLKGSSGTVHLIPLLLTTNNGEQVAIEFISEESNIEQVVLQLLLRSADLEKMKVIIASKSSVFVDKIKGIVNPQKVKVFEAHNMSSLSDMIVRELLVNG